MRGSEEEVAYFRSLQEGREDPSKTSWSHLQKHYRKLLKRGLLRRALKPMPQVVGMLVAGCRPQQVLRSPY